VRTLSQKMVRGVAMEDDLFRLDVGTPAATSPVLAKSIILASGRFFGKGLRGTRQGVVEPVFDIPITQPESRDVWHNPEYFDTNGHAVNMAGIEVDASMRPLGADGNPVHGRLHAAGAILAHHDWMRMKCGAGLAIATAYKAVERLKL